MSTVAISDESGQLKESYAYDTYGNIIEAKDKTGNNLSSYSTQMLYTGRELDSETGLYYNRARYYDSSLGRFISADPKGYAAGLNLYAYVKNNPLTFRDPQGTDPYWGGGYGGYGGGYSYSGERGGGIPPGTNINGSAARGGGGGGGGGGCSSCGGGGYGGYPGSQGGPGHSSQSDDDPLRWTPERNAQIGEQIRAGMEKDAQKRAFEMFRHRFDIQGPQNFTSFGPAYHASVNFLSSPAGHQFLSKTSELSGAAATATAIAALNPLIFPEAVTATLIFKGISVAAKAIDLSFQSNNIIGDTLEEIIKIYTGTKFGPIYSPFVKKALDLHYEYLKNNEN